MVELNAGVGRGMSFSETRKYNNMVELDPLFRPLKEYFERKRHG